MVAEDADFDEWQRRVAGTERAGGRTAVGTGRTAQALVLPGLTSGL